MNACCHLQYTEYLLPCIGAAIAALVAWVGYQQFQLAKDRFKLDLFEKRMAVYKATGKILSSILRNGTAEYADLNQFLGDTSEAAFLFGSEISTYLEELYKKGVRLHSATAQYKSLPSGPERIRLVESETRLLIELTDELPRLRRVFASYLKFAKWS